MVKNVFPNISVDVNVGDWQEVDGRLLSFKTPELGLFGTISKKSLYLVCVKYLNLRALKDLPETKWTNFVELGTSPKDVGDHCIRNQLKKEVGTCNGGFHIGFWQQTVIKFI